jgi:two-component system chemotaxis response regulator CheY
MSQFKILIVDDEYGITFMVDKIYTKRGFTVFKASDGIKAVEIFKKERPDLVFIDIHMPYSPIDGVETLRQIKNIEQNASCVMLTRIYDNITIGETKALGAMHYITKPFETEDLDKCVKEVEAKIAAEGGQ